MFKQVRTICFSTLCLLIAVIAIAACAAPPPAAPPVSAPTSAPAQATTASEQPTTVSAAAKSVDTDWPNMTWDEVVADAKGQSINWYMWGGNTSINDYVSKYLGDRLKSEYDITMNRVVVNDTVEAVNKVLGEKQAGKTSDGSVDMIWINGENFKTMKQGDLLFGPFLDNLPNYEYLNPDTAFVNVDFGTPIDGYEAPWTRSQFVIEYDSANISDPPKTIQGLLEWACDNPGKFTYIAPPQFTGTAFLTHLLYDLNGGPEAFQGPFDQAKWDEASAELWTTLNELKPCLWRNGETYAKDPAQLDDLFSNGEVSFGMNYGVNHAATQVKNGKFPESTRTFVFDNGTVANASYVAIPFNAANKAAALVVANLILEPQASLYGAVPANWGNLSPLDEARLPADVKAGFAAIELPPQTLTVAQLANQLPPLTPDYIKALEAGFNEKVLQAQ